MNDRDMEKSNTEPIVKVGILLANSIEFVLNNNYKCSNGAQYINKHVVELRNNQLWFDNKAYDKLEFISDDADASFDLIDVVIGIDFHWERKENQCFKSALSFVVEDNKVRAINELKVEDYLLSVISSEMSATASDELLKAHAVISRSWLLACMGEQTNSASHGTEFRTVNEHGEEVIQKWYERDAHIDFDVCADDHCQRYQGITRASTAAVGRAIEATRGMVLMYENEICDARYSKSCGGVSETFDNCWAPTHYPYLSKIIDNPVNPQGFSLDLRTETHADAWIRQQPEAFCNTHDKEILSQVLNNYDQETTDFYRWKQKYTQNELSALIKKRSGIDFGQIVDLIPVARGESARLVKLRIVGTLRTVVVGKELEIRKWLSPSHLYSSAFVVDKLDIIDGIPQNFVLHGAGWGHGVGLCQIGAAVMGAKGYKYDEILLHYFRGAELKSVYL